MRGQPLPYDCLHHLVARQSATGNDPPHLRTQFGVVLDIPPQDIADGDVFQVEIVGQDI
jgi:hypothetical protein